MTKKENAALANENGASNRANDTTFGTHDFADLAEAMECLEKHVGFPVTLKALETWVVDDLLTRLISSTNQACARCRQRPCGLNRQGQPPSPPLGGGGELRLV